jgi:hypothetical protein
MPTAAFRRSMLYTDSRLLGNNGSRGLTLPRGRRASDAGSRSDRALDVLDAGLYYLSRGVLRGDIGLGENASIVSVEFTWL